MIRRSTIPTVAGAGGRATRPKPKAERNRRSHQSELSVEGKQLAVSNLDKVLYPKDGFTKGAVIDYYIRMAPALLPHLKDRPLTLKRYPDGVEGEFFYEKRCPIHRPDWVQIARVWSDRSRSEIHFCLVNDLPSLIWVANLAGLELHTFLSRSKSMQSPTVVVFDLDPGPPANIVQCAQVGIWLKEMLDKLKLESFPKTSGSKGLQVYVPLNSPASFDVTKTFAKTIAELLEQQNPKVVVSKMSKLLRKGKVFVDWSQNDEHKTTVCVYSLRAKERPTVSTPVQWDEVHDALKSEDTTHLTFDWQQALKRVEKHGDLFAPVLNLKQKIP